jgi:hypothetical protein
MRTAVYVFRRRHAEKLHLQHNKNATLRFMLDSGTRMRTSISLLILIASCSLGEYLTIDRHVVLVEVAVSALAAGVGVRANDSIDERGLCMLAEPALPS